MDNQQTIAEIGEERRAKVFRPDTTRVIKPRSLEEVDAIPEGNEPCE